MATSISKISSKVSEWARLSDFSIEKIKEHLKDSPETFAVEKLTAKEAEEEGCDSNYPYRLFNPYNYDVDSE